MKNSNRDWVQLSAYLDGELSAREIKKLESRLAAEPGLQASLEDLRVIKGILSRTPRLKVPHNFTLSPEQAGIKHARAAAAGYSWTAAVLSFLFIAVVVVDLGSGSLKGAPSLAMAPRSEQIVPEAAMEAAPAADSLEEPTLLEAEQAVESQNAGDQETEIAQEAAAPAAEEEVSGAVSSAEEENLQEGAASDLEEGQAKTAPEEADRAVEPEAEGGVGMEAEEQAGLAPAPTAEAVPERYYEVTEEQLPRQGMQVFFPWIRILEAILGVGAAGFGLAAWSRRRRKR
jgi:hypothetical protein